MQKTHLLVLGAPRSGTTLLTTMIGRHDEVGMLNENFGRAMQDLVSKRVVGNKLCIPNHIEVQKKRAAWLRFLGTRGYYTLHKYGYFQYRPEALLSIEDYLQWKPLKIIGIIRDGNAIVSSIMKRGKQPESVARYRWRRSIEILSYLHSHHSEKLLLLSFSQLVSTPELAMKAVASHIDLPYQPAMLKGYAFTPNYNNKKIDASKAINGTKSPSVSLQNSEPGTYEAYQVLLDECHRRIDSISIKDG